MFLEVSSGEGFDKLSILEIKYSKITSPEKQAAVLREITALSSIKFLKEKYPFEYASIVRVNEEIWDLTEVLDPQDPDFARISERIFELNRQRFRVKRMINSAENSQLKEQKSFGDKHCVIELDVDPYSRITELYSIVFEYDTFSFDRPCRLRPFVNFLDSAPETFATIKLSALGRKVKVTPIRYGCGGRLGDTIHQMSVVNEMYLKTGRKGTVYLSPTLGDQFDRDIERTFADIKTVICDQPYIGSFQLHQGEEFDINLSKWRTHNHSYDASWHQAFEGAFGIPWAASPWISVVPNLQYKETTFISCGDNRRNSVLRYAELRDRIPNLVFLATSQSMYELFVQRNGVEMPYLVCPTFSDLAGVLMACKGLIGSLSMPLALTDAMWKPRLAILYSYDYDCKVAMLTDKRFIIHTEDLDAFGWQMPVHPRTIVPGTL